MQQRTQRTEELEALALEIDRLDDQLDRVVGDDLELAREALFAFSTLRRIHFRLRQRAGLARP